LLGKPINMTHTPPKVWLQAGRLPASQAPLLLVHGGAGPQDPKGERFLNGQKFLSQILTDLQVLKPSDAIEALKNEWSSLSHSSRLSLYAIRAMESEPLLNSGLGASLQGDGMARVSSSFMESQKRVFSAVINTNSLEHPSELAWWLQRERFSVLDSFGAQNLSEQLNCRKKNIVTPYRMQRWIEHKKQALQGKFSTVGAISIDENHTLSVITSTGGVGNETPGRVGDSPTIAGNYCTSEVAVSCTGIGEQIMSHAVAPKLAILVEGGMSLKQAAEKTFQEAAVKKFEFAAIAAAYHAKENEIEWVAATSHCQMLCAVSVGGKISLPSQNETEL